MPKLTSELALKNATSQEILPGTDGLERNKKEQQIKPIFCSFLKITEEEDKVPGIRMC